MSAYVKLIAAWGLVTLFLAVLLFYRSRLTRRESDWIPLTEDEREDRAIQTQTIIEMKARWMTWPIRGLGVLSVILLLVIVAFWAYQGINTPPAMP